MLQRGCGWIPGRRDVPEEIEMLGLHAPATNGPGADRRLAGLATWEAVH